MVSPLMDNASHWGAAVIFKPAATQQHASHKMKGDSTHGVLADYELGPGYTWQGLYKVWPLEDCVGTDLSISSKAMMHRSNMPHVVKTVELPSKGIYFPLCDEYE